MTDFDAGGVPNSYDAYAADRENPRFTDWLRERTEPVWTEATTHRFTRELGDGTVDDDVFRRYLLQDYAFVETLVGAFGHAVGDAPTMAAKTPLVDFLGTLTADENDYFERSFDALDVPESAYADPERTPTTEAFVDLLERASREGGYAETLAVLVPAEWVYLTWARAGADEGDESSDTPSQFYHAEWVDLHASEEFAAFVDWLRRELDREGAAASAGRRRPKGGDAECSSGVAASERRQERLARLFSRTVELEAAFFESTYDPEYDPVRPKSAAPSTGGDA